MTIVIEHSALSRQSFTLHNVRDGDSVKVLRAMAAGAERLQADGFELETIKKQFSNIPMCNGPVVMWYGDTAKFIAKNICLVE